VSLDYLEASSPPVWRNWRELPSLRLTKVHSVLHVVPSNDVPTGVCLATDWRDLAVGVSLQALDVSRLWVLARGRKKSEVADKAALDEPFDHSLRRNAHYKRSMSLARDVPAAELGDSHVRGAVVQCSVLLL
jgi:hypothetical protein